MKTEGTNLLVAVGHIYDLQKAEKYPIRWSL